MVKFRAAPRLRHARDPPTKNRRAHIATSDPRSPNSGIGAGDLLGFMRPDGASRLFSPANDPRSRRRPGRQAGVGRAGRTLAGGSGTPCHTQDGDGSECRLTSRRVRGQRQDLVLTYPHGGCAGTANREILGTTRLTAVATFKRRGREGVQQVPLAAPRRPASRSPGETRGPGEMSDSKLAALVYRHARCARCPVDPDQWFPVSYDTAKARAEAADAIAVCDSCPVRAQCLELSFRNNPGFGAHGVWGGLVEGERRPMPATARRAGPAVPVRHVPARRGTGC